MEREIIILMATTKGRYFYIAGLDRNSNSWVRVHSRCPNTRGAIPLGRLIYRDYTPVHLFDVAEIKFDEPDNCFEQPERLFYDESQHWRLLEHITFLDVIDIHGFDQRELIFYNRERYVLPNELSAVDNRESLLLLYVNDLKVKVQQGRDGKHIFLNFNHDGKEYSGFSIGDLRLQNCYKARAPGIHHFADEAAVVFSLSEKYRDRYYKSAAQILRWR